MRRWFALPVSAILIAVAVFAWRSDRAVAGLPPPPAFAAEGRFAAPAAAPRTLAPVAPEPPRATTEARRFARYDKDRNAGVTRAEYAASRQRAFAKLDLDRDGRLSFDEYSAKALTRFDAADSDQSGVLTRAEFATTATKRKPRADCPPEPARDSSDA